MFVSNTLIFNNKLREVIENEFLSQVQDFEWLNRFKERSEVIAYVNTKNVIKMSTKAPLIIFETTFSAAS